MADLKHVPVIGRFGINVGDGPDAGENPDTIWCDEGIVRLAPLQSPTKFLSGDPMPFTTGNAAIDCTFDANGHLSWNGKPRVWVVDLTDENLLPHVDEGDATYRVSFIGCKANGDAVEFPPNNVRIASDTMTPGIDPETGDSFLACDLTKLLPATVGPGVAIVVGDQGVSVTGVVQESPDEVAFELSDGSTTDPVTLPAGPPGGVNEVAGLQGDVSTADLFDELQPLVSAQSVVAVTDAMGNPESSLQGATVQVVNDTLGGGAANLTLVHQGALSDPDAARPVWAGVVDWWVYEGGLWPIHAVDGDVVTFVAVVSQEDTPGFADAFSGPAGAVGVTPSGRKPWSFATRSGPGGVTWSRNGAGAAGLTSGSGGNATCVADALTGHGTISLQLATVAAGNAGVAFRYVDHQNYLYATRLNSSNARLALFSCVAGTATQIAGSTAPTGFDLTSNRLLTIHDNPSTGQIIVDVDGVTALNLTGITAHATATKCGLYASPSAGMPAPFAGEISMVPA